MAGKINREYKGFIFKKTAAERAMQIKFPLNGTIVEKVVWNKPMTDYNSNYPLLSIVSF